LSVYWGRRELSARDIQEFQRQIDHDLYWQPALADDPAQRHGPPDAQALREFRRNFRVS